MSSIFLPCRKHMISYMSHGAPLRHISMKADTLLYLHDKYGFEKAIEYLLCEVFIWYSMLSEFLLHGI